MSDLERAMIFFIKAAKLPTPQPEYQFLDDRKFRFDFAWPERKVALEVEGGSWGKSRHTTGTGFARDCEKYSLAAAEGWLVIRATTDQVHDGSATGWVKRALEMRAA